MSAKRASLLQIFTRIWSDRSFSRSSSAKGNEGFGNGNFQALFESIELDQIRRGVITSTPDTKLFPSLQGRGRGWGRFLKRPARGRGPTPNPSPKREGLAQSSAGRVVERKRDDDILHPRLRQPRRDEAVPAPSPSAATRRSARLTACMPSNSPAPHSRRRATKTAVPGSIAYARPPSIRPTSPIRVHPLRPRHQRQPPAPQPPALGPDADDAAGHRLDRRHDDDARQP